MEIDSDQQKKVEDCEKPFTFEDSNVVTDGTATDEHWYGYCVRK